MNDQEHLVLRLARLKPVEVLEPKLNGLVFLLSKGGVGKYTSKVAAYRVVPGDVLVFKGATGSRLAVFDKNGEFLFWTFSVCFEDLLPLFTGEEISMLRGVIDGFNAGKVYPASSPLAVECQRLLPMVPAQFNLDHRGQLVRIAATILSAEFKEGLSKRCYGCRPMDHMVQVFDKLSASELIGLSVGDLAARVHCSRRHLNRLFHQHFGTSVAALRMEMRLLKAISLLRDADAKIINVAEQCGFNHLGLFNACFKRRFGASPGQWRKSSVLAASAKLTRTETKSGCPLHHVGLCPLTGEPASALPVAVTSCARKIVDGEEVLEDLKRGELVFGAGSLVSGRRSLSAVRSVV